MDDLLITPEEVQQARTVVAAHVQDASIEMELLDALGLLNPETEQTLYA